MRRVLLTWSAVLGLVAPAFGATLINLGQAETFSVLGASTVTNTGASQLKGNLGVSPGTAIVGFPPGLVLRGTTHVADAVAMQAQADLTTAYNAYKGLPCNFNMTGQDLGGLTLTPGVYCFDSSAQLTGALVLDFQNSTQAAFTFQIGSTLTTASNATVAFANCTHHCAVNWQVGSSATLGTSTMFSGNILALASITLNTNVHLCGRALAQTGAVTLDTDNVFFGGSLTAPPPAQVTGQGQIAVPQFTSADPDATGTGKASFAFTSGSNGKDTFFEYLDYVSGVRVYGSVYDISVIAAYPDGSIKTVQLLGTCHSSLPQCSFLATIEKPTLPGGSAQLGVIIDGRLNENWSKRPLIAGQIQYR